MAEDFLDRLIQLEKDIRYMRTYTARVIDNKIGDGKMKLSCEELGWDDEFSYSIATPHDNPGSRILPEIGDYIELSFHAGKEEYPVWGRVVHEIIQTVPSEYSKETDRIIFEDRKTKDFIKYDSNSKKLEAKATEIILNDGSKGVARLDDTTTSTATVDSIFWAWIAAAGTVLSGLSHRRWPGDLSGHPTCAAFHCLNRSGR